jgi:hypothetical protein
MADRQTGLEPREPRAPEKAKVEGTIMNKISACLSHGEQPPARCCCSKWVSPMLAAILLMQFAVCIHMSSAAEATAGKTKESDEPSGASQALHDKENSPSTEASSLSSHQTTSVRELSVPPATLPLLPLDRPAWVGAPPDLDAEIHRLYVGSLVADDPQQVDPLLDEPLVASLQSYIRDHVLPQTQAAHLLKYHLSADYIRKNLIDDPDGFVAELNAASGPLFQKWIVVTISPQQREQMKQWYHEALQRQRLIPLFVALVGVVGSVGFLHLALRGWNRPRRTARATANTTGISYHSSSIV